MLLSLARPVGAGQEPIPRIDPDRPHLPEASTAVGTGQVVVESGFTFTGGDTDTQTYPEVLLRAGAFAQWFELRAGATFVDDRAPSLDGSAARGADLYVGMKAVLSKANGVVPAIAIIPQATIDSRSGPHVDRVLPGVNVDASWDVLENRDDVEVVVATNRVAQVDGGSHLEIATGFTNVVQFRNRFELFEEWDAYAPTQDAVPPRHYAVGGLVFFASNDLALDVRIGAGLNRAARGLVLGAGLAVRPHHR